jgi:hypothetical protein
MEVRVTFTQRGAVELACHPVRFQRTVACWSYAASGVLFLVGLRALYEAEGPGRPDVQYQLASPGGQSLFAQVALSLSLAVILAALASVGLFWRLFVRSPHWSLLALLCTWLAAALFVGLLSVQYGMMAVGQEGIAPTEVSFHALAVFAHGVADLGGWMALGLLGLSVLINSVLIWSLPGGKGPAALGWVICVSLLLLYLLSASFFFMLPFAVWELAISGYLLFAPVADQGASQGQQ